MLKWTGQRRILKLNKRRTLWGSHTLGRSQFREFSQSLQQSADRSWEKGKERTYALQHLNPALGAARAFSSFTGWRPASRTPRTKKDCLREISRGAPACCDATSLEWRTVINYLHLRRCKSLPLLWRSRSTRSSTTARGPAGRPARVLANLKAYRVEKTNVWPTLDS